MKPMMTVLGSALVMGGSPQVMGATLLMDDFTGPALNPGGVPPLLPAYKQEDAPEWH